MNSIYRITILPKSKIGPTYLNLYKRESHYSVNIDSVNFIHL